MEARRQLGRLVLAERRPALLLRFGDSLAAAGAAGFFPPSNERTAAICSSILCFCNSNPSRAAS
jgi:hypothetical protein